MQLEQNSMGDGDAVRPVELRDRPYAPSGSSRARLRSVRVDVHPERKAAWRADAGGRLGLTLTGELVVKRERRADMLILWLSGQLDLATSALLERELEAAEAAHPLHLVVDLGGLEFIDPTGLEILARVHDRASENGDRLSLRQGPRVVPRQFELDKFVHGSRSMTDAPKPIRPIRPAGPMSSRPRPPGASRSITNAPM